MASGQRRPSFDLSIGDSAFLKHELESMKAIQESAGGGDDRFKPLESRPSDAAWEKTDNWLEARLFLELAGVSSLMNLAFIASPLLTASYIGRSFSPVYLSAFTLANLTGNLCTFSLMAGLFSASDTLSPQAFGRGDFSEVGRIAIRGFVASSSLLLPINIALYCYLEPLMIALGQDAEASFHASQWYRVFIWSLPFAVLFNCLWKFLTAQHIMKPLILVSLSCTCLFLPLSLQFFIESMGFLGSAVAYVSFQAFQALALLAYVYFQQPHEAETWPGLSIDTVVNALEWRRMKVFLNLGVGGIVAQCEWIFWEAVGLVVGQLGVVALSVHTIPNQTIMAFCMVPFSFGIALAIRMGISIPISVRRTQKMVVATVGYSTILFGLVSIGVYVYQDAFVGLFTNSDDVKELAEDIWPHVSIFNLNVAIFGVLAGVATGLGMQWPLGVINFVFLWLLGLPMMYYSGVMRDGGLESVWFWMNIPYMGMNVTLTALFVSTDWRKIQKEILSGGSRESVQANDGEAADAPTNERTSLL